MKAAARKLTVRPGDVSMLEQSSAGHTTMPHSKLEAVRSTHASSNMTQRLARYLALAGLEPLRSCCDYVVCVRTHSTFAFVLLEPLRADSLQTVSDLHAKHIVPAVHALKRVIVRSSAVQSGHLAYSHSLSVISFRT